MGIVLANVAQAQNRGDDELKVGDYAPTFEAEEWLNIEPGETVPDLVELRGMVVVMFFWVSWHAGGEFIIKFVNQFSNNPAIGRAGGVYTIGLTDATRKATADVLADNKVFFPVGVKSKSAKEYDIEGGFGFVVVDPEGKIAFKGSGGDVQGLVNAIQKALVDTPPSKTHPKEARIVRAQIDRCREYIANREYRRAFKAATDALQRTVIGDRLASEVYDIIDLLEAIGYEQIDRAIPLIEHGKYDEGARLLRAVKRQLRVLQCGKDAEKLFERYEDEYDGFRDAVEAHASEDEAARLYYAAREDLRLRRFGEAYRKLEQITTDYADTEAKPYAVEMINRMKANKDLWGWVLDAQAKVQCEQWLTQAKTYLRNRENQKARTLLERILREYPDTIYEQEARELLINMP
ncbi:MAG: hypothetical protein D6744_01415 [Planctomycetota bacterium]|nr:MAG: hypothetical protein D6744_01415 [Planctomycetota bacterium]